MDEPDDIMPTTKSPKGKVAKATVDDLQGRMSMINLNNVPLYSMDFKLPFVISSFQKELDDFVKVEVFVPTLPIDFFNLDIVDDGKTLKLTVRMPSFFTDESRVLLVNEGVAGFNQNTSEAQSYKTICERIASDFSLSPNIFGKPMLIGLPFICDERIDNWGLQAYKNDEVEDEFEADQYHMVLFVVIRKQRSRRKVAGTFKIVGVGNGT